MSNVERNVRDGQKSTAEGGERDRKMRHARPPCQATCTASLNITKICPKSSKLDTRLTKGMAPTE